MGPRSLVKTQIFEKKGYSSNGKLFTPRFSRIVEFDKHQGTAYKGPQGNLTINVEDIRSLLRDLEVL